MQLSRWISSILAVSLVMLVSCDKYDQTAAEPSVIILDPGHGGEDPGAIGGDTVYEKDLNLSICRYMRDELLANGYAVVMTRDEDKMLYTDSENIKGIRKISDLKNRVKLFNSYGNAVVISIHMNSFSDSKYSGFQVYYSVNNDNSKALADTVQNLIKETLQPNNNRKTKPGNNLFVLDKIYSPAVLIECGFLSNLEECEKLCNEEYRKKLAFIICTATEKYIENTLEMK